MSEGIAKVKDQHQAAAPTATLATSIEAQP